MITTAGRIGMIAALTVLIAGVSSAQDLGSANKLFGGGKPTSKKSATSAAKKPSAKKTTAKPKVAAKKPPAKAKSTPAAAKPTATATKDARFKAYGTPAATKAPDAATLRRFNDLIRLGNDARDARRYPEAERSYKSAAAAIATDARPWAGLGNVYSDQHRWEEAESAYRRALDLDGRSVTAHVALVYILTQPLALANLGERYEEAERLARRAIALAPDNALAFDQLGAALELRGLIGSETEGAYRRSIALAPNFAPSYAHLARLLRRRGMAKEAGAASHEAITRAHDAATRIVVAEVLQSEQRYMESEPLLRAALADDPRNAAALLLLGRSLMAQSEFPEAESVLKQALSTSSNGYAANSVMAELHLRQGNFDRAEAALNEAARHALPLEKLQLARQFRVVGNGYKKAGSSSNATRAFRKAATLEAESGNGRSKS